jgi:serine/threonine protein kinase
MTEPQSGAEVEGAPLRRWDPERIGPYVILGRLGAGAMGQVYLGRSAAGRLVAVKTIKVELAEEAGFRTRFAQEVAAARRVSGFFTAAVVEADPDADLPWLATAYVPAPSLARLVAAVGPLPVTTVRWLAAGCAEALESIHGVGLVHRDLKPSNVLVAPDGPRVIDFGVARAAERMGLTTSRGAVGTPAYMAPEQARDPHQASAASDVYALGATLLFAATGHPPYLGDSILDVLARLATDEPDLSGLPADLAPLITACLQRAPRERPSSSSMLAQLGQFTEARPDAAGAHSYLPDAAMTLIEQYQRNPLLASGQPGQASQDDSGDSTSASYTELPASYRPKRRRPASRPQKPAGRRRWLRTHLAWVGWVSVGAALVVGGVILGASLSSSGSPSQPPAAPPAPQTVCGTVQAASGPSLCMVRQSQGSPATPFTVQGNGFTPGSPVTFTVSEVDPGGKTLFSTPSLRNVTAGQDGTFRIAVSQLYSKPLSGGLVTVTASEPGSPPASTQFMVIPPGPPPAGAPPGQ